MIYRLEHEAMHEHLPPADPKQPVAVACASGPIQTKEVESRRRDIRPTFIRLAFLLPCRVDVAGNEAVDLVERLASVDATAHGATDREMRFRVALNRRL